MKIRCPFTLKSCISTILICLFLFRGLQMYLKMHRSDQRLDLLGVITSKPFDGDNPAMYLRKIQNRLKMQNFELIQMMNQTNPNLISQDVMLVVSASHSLVQNTYAHLLQKIQKTNSANNSLPFYLLRKGKSFLLQNTKSIIEQVEEIVKVIEYFTDDLMVKKLTILSFQQGSVLCLRALAYIKYDAFSIIDKLILINALNPNILILHGNSAQFMQQTKQLILSDPIRTQLTNGTRIIIIHTVDNNPGDQKINWLFKTTTGQSVTFANSIVIQSKLMWNVYSYLKPQQYFRFEPFLQIITKLFHEDGLKQQLSIKQINYLLLYRQLSVQRYLTIQKRNKILSKCIDLYMQNYNYQGQVFNAQCIRILRKQNFYFNQNTTLIIRSLGKFQVYGENYQKLIPYDTKNKQTIFLLENVLEYRRIFVINSRKYAIHISIQPVLRPHIVKFDFVANVLTQHQIYTRFRLTYNKNSSQPVALCPGYTILYPSSLVPILYQAYFHLSSQFWVQQRFDCYIVLGNLTKYWSLGLNLIILSLFCLNAAKKSTFSRFYYQLIVNYTLSFLHTGQSLLSQNLVVLAIVVVIQLLLKLATFMSDMIYMPKKLASKVMWIPFLFQILRWFKANLFFSPWKAILLIFFAGTRKNNAIILFLKFSFIMQYIIRDISNPEGLFLCCSWLAISTVQQQPQQKQLSQQNNTNVIITSADKKLLQIKQNILLLRKYIVDTITICVMVICLSEEGIVFHYIINFYIITFIIFAAHQKVNDLM